MHFIRIELSLNVNQIVYKNYNENKKSFLFCAAQCCVRLRIFEMEEKKNNNKRFLLKRKKLQLCVDVDIEKVIDIQHMYFAFRSHERKRIKAKTTIKTFLYVGIGSKSVHFNHCLLYTHTHMKTIINTTHRKKMMKIVHQKPI